MEHDKAYGEVNKLIEPDSDYKMMTYASKLQRLHDVIYIDCSNSFDPYFIFRKSGKNPKSLERIHVVRPFTLFQLRQLVEEKLEKKIIEVDAKTLLIPYIDSYGWDHVFQDNEYLIVTGRIMEMISSLTVDYELFTVVSFEDGKDA